MDRRDRSERLFERAQTLIPGGVNSPVRAFQGVGGTPPFIARASGAYVYDEDQNRYVDYVGSWGPMLLGHAEPRMVEAVREAVTSSTSFGAPTAIEVEVAALVTALIPSIERVRMVNSGTEATMSAVRLARGATGWERIIKFAGHYHGHADFFLIEAGSGATTLGQPNSPGVTHGAPADTLIARFNDADSVRAHFDRYPREIACVILEPVAGNMGCVPPEPGFLQQLRQMCDEFGALLIFDEVMTGFRVARGGAQERFGVTPDLTTLGKIIGGGMPVGAYGGRADVMEQVAPSGPVYQAGTLSGNPVAMAAGYAMLRHIADDETLYDRLEAYGHEWDERLREVLQELDWPLHRARVGSMGCLYFTEERVTDYDTARTSDTKRYARYFHSMLDQGIYLAPSQFEAWFVSAAHGPVELEKTIGAQRTALRAAREAEETG